MMTRSAILHVLIVLIASDMSWSHSFAQDSVDTTFARDEVLGPFTLGKGRTKTVSARVTHVHLGHEEDPEWPDTDTLMLVQDERGRKLLELSAYTTLGAAVTDFACDQIYIPTIGSALRCTRRVGPVDGIEGESFGLYGANSGGEFVPISEWAVGLEYKFVFLDARTQQRPILLDSSLSYAVVAIEFEYWTGFCDAKVYQRIYPEGYVAGRDRALFHFDEIPIALDTSVIRQSRLDKHESDFEVALFRGAAGESAHVQRVTVNRNSAIKYFHASFIRGWWLLLSIDGQKGYVSESECYELGFPITSGNPVWLGDDY